MCCDSWGHKESDTTETTQQQQQQQQHMWGEGNDPPLQYSCLENLRGGGAWWAACLWGHTESDMTKIT